MYADYSQHATIVLPEGPRGLVTNGEFDQTLSGLYPAPDLSSSTFESYSSVIMCNSPLANNNLVVGSPEMPFLTICHTF